MSKRYRNGFKRTLCRWRIPTPITSYRNIRSNGNNNNNNAMALSPALAGPNNVHHQRLTYSNNNQKSDKLNNSFCRPRRRDNVFTFSMSKYRFVIGSRTLADHRNCSVHYRRRTSFHYRFSVAEQQERDEQQRQLQSQLQQRKFSMSLMQHPKKHRTKFIFSTVLPPATPPNSSNSESRTLTLLPNGNPPKH